MAKARLYFDGDNTYIEKQARIYKMVDEIGDKIDNIPGVINNLSSTSETDALSAAMWKELQDQINAMSWNFHFLSSWDCTTGLPWSDPATDPYTYTAWDYYIVSTVASGGGTNYKPHWATYTHWVASTAVETQAVQMNDWYVYDGSTWILQPSGWQTIVIDTALSDTSTNPVENRVITQALNNKQNTIANLSAIESWAAAWATALQPWANITQLTNNAWYQTAGDVASAISWKQDTLTAGEGIAINNNIITNTWITCLQWSWDIKVSEWVDYELPEWYTALEYLTSDWEQYIDTWIKLVQTNWIWFYCDYIPRSAFATSWNTFWCILWWRTSSWNNDLQLTTYTQNSTSEKWTIRYWTNVWYEMAMVLNSRAQTSLINWTLVSTTLPSSIAVTSYTFTDNSNNIYLFWLNNWWTFTQSGTWNTIYRAKFYNWNEVIADFVPCEYNNTLWMYDLIWEAFHSNQWTWTFTAWPGVGDCTTVSFTNASWYMLKSSNKLIYATTDTAFNTRDKICTTADWNYTPREWDVLALVFNNGCWVGSPRLNIDNSWLHSIVISSTGWANASTLWLGMSKIAWTFVYDWTNRVTWPIKDTTYTAWTWLSLSSWTFSNTQPWPTIWTTAPSSPTEWAMWYDSTNHVLKVYDGSQWVEVGSWWGWGSTTWWNIWGILSNQTDLQDALDDKLWATDLIAWDGINIQAVWSALPSWYVQVAYLTLNWTQALDTWITWIWKTVEVDTQCTNPSGASWQIVWTYWEDYLWMFFWAIGWSWAVQNSSAWKIAWVNVGDRNTITWRFSLPSNQNKVELTVSWNTVSYTRTATARPDANINIWWAISTTNTLLYPYSWYIFWARIYNTATNVEEAHYIPCLNPINIAGFYDTVSDTFLPATKWTFAAWPVVPVEWIEVSVDNTVWTDDNVEAWTGISIDTWTSARLPSWYTEVEWIQSDGNCAIDSWVSFQTVDRVEVVWNFVENQWWFRCVVWCDNQNATSWWKYWVLLWEWSWWVYYTEWTSTSWIDYVYSSTTPDTNQHTFQTYYANGKLYISVDGTTDDVNWLRSTWVTTTLWIFSRHLQASNSFATSSSKFKMKTIKMWNWSVLMFDWVPCKRDSDDEPWLYDLVNDVFLANQGSGTLATWQEVVFDPTKIISSTVLDFTNLTYDSLASDTWSATSSVAFPSTAKVAFITWRAIKWGVIYAAWETIFPRTNWFIKSSFIWWWASSSEFVSWWIMYDYQTWNIVYTKTDWAWSVVIDYAIYFYK